MEDRRSFLKKCAVTTVAFSVPSFSGCGSGTIISSAHTLKTMTVNKALVTWYSQTGYTEAHGRLIAYILEAEGIAVTSSELGSVDLKTINNYQLIIVGSPVFYYDTPDYVKRWMASLPEIIGIPVASYVTYGGPEGNQYNAACSILEGLADKGGVPIAINSFMNIGAYPPLWSGKKIDEHTWAIRHLPDEATYQRVRNYAKDIISKVKTGQRAEFSKTMNLREFATFLNPVWWTKRFIDQHYILKDKCIECGTCADKCPAGAIDLADFTIDRNQCELCFGCLNNCPAQAIYMTQGSRRLIGYLDFIRTNHIRIIPPQELMNSGKSREQ